MSRWARWGAVLAAVAVVATFGSAGARAGDPVAAEVEGRTVAQWLERTRSTDVDEVTQAIRVLSSKAVREGPEAEAEAAASAIGAIFESALWLEGEKGEWVRRIAIDALPSFQRRALAAAERLARLAEGDAPEAVKRNVRAAMERLRLLHGKEVEGKARRTKSIDNVRSLIMFYLGADIPIAKPWPKFNGKAFILWLVATGNIPRKDADALQILFSPADETRSLEKAGGVAAYEKVTLQALMQGGQDWGVLTSYVGRGAAGPDAKIAGDEAVPIIADVSFEDGAVVGYTNGAARWLTREELGIPAGVPITVGPDSPSPILRQFSAD